MLIAVATALNALPNGAAGMTFAFMTAVVTPKGKTTTSGTIALKPTGPQKFTLTVTTSDGKSQTIPLVVQNGTLAPDPTHMASSSQNSQPQAAAKALLSNMKLATQIGMAARKNPGKGFAVDVNLSPVGNGTAIPEELTMKATLGSNGSTTCSGSVQAQTTTQLPPASGLDPQQLVKSVGIGVATHGVTPAGRAVIAICRHHETEEQKEEAAGDLPDAIGLTVTTHFVNGRFNDISGNQTDSLTIGKKETKVVSNWSFTATK